MTSNHERVTRAAFRLVPHTVLAAWRGITRKQLAITFLLGCALAIPRFLVLAPQRSLAGALFIFITSQIIVFVMLPALVVADQLTDRNPERRGIYALAVIVGSAVGTTIAMNVGKHALSPWLFHQTARDLGIGFFLYLFFDIAMLNMAAVWVINDRRRAARARALMHRAELERIDAAKRTVESELQAMQARVEPQFLFNTLAQVKRLYERDALQGERMLEELIAYLRAAMPRMRDTSSTVGQELELARAYLAIVGLRLDRQLIFTVDDPGRLRAARMPPMMLLPLLEAIVHGPEASTAIASIRVSVQASDGVLRVTVDTRGIGLDHEERIDIASTRERLSSLYAERAGLVVHPPREGATKVILEVPFEPDVHRGIAQTDESLRFSDAAVSGTVA